MRALVVWLITVAWCVHGSCPPESGIYLTHGGYCLPEYTVISDFALTADNPLHCVLAGGTGGGGGQWTGPNSTQVQCSGESGPFTCSQSSDPTNITLYKKTPEAKFSGKQLYTCTISGQSISVQIKVGKKVSAIYIEPPADVRSVPQNYTIHCITTEQSSSNIKLFLENIISPVLGYSQVPPLFDQLNANTYDHFEEVVWRADRVVVDVTYFSNQGFSQFNGDHDWACDVSGNVLQIYIRAPNFTPTELTLVHKNATSATISWTAVNATEADGYVVYSTQLPQSTNTTAVDVGNVTQYTLGGLVPGNTYNITVRAYQDLLGPESDGIQPNISAVVLQPLSWSLLSNRTSPVAQYRVYCSAAYVIPEYIVWRKNGTVVMNSTSTTISHQLVDEATDNYTNILTVTGDHHTQAISCGVQNDSISYQTHNNITINASSGPPNNVIVSINSSSSITVSWSPPLGGAGGYVILYSAEGASNMTQLVEGGDQTSSLLTGLSEGQLYTIRVFAYKDLPSLLSDPVLVRIHDHVPDAVFDLKAVSVSSTTVTVLWSYSHAILSRPVWFTVTYYSTTCNNQSISEKVNETTEEISIDILPGQSYNVSVTASNAIGDSNATSIVYTSLSDVPGAPPHFVSVLAVNSSSVNLSWVELPCVEKNGEITGYLINYTSTSADDDESGEIMAQADTSSTIVTDLSACIAYNFRVAAMNINGTGPFSHAIHMSTITPVPGFVSNLSISLETPTSLNVSWSYLQEDLEEYITHYLVTYTTCCENQLLKNTANVSGTAVTITDLEEGMNYNISVIPVSCDGQMGISTNTTGSTAEVVPTGAPNITNAVAINETTIFVSWTKIDCLQQNGIITNYTIAIISSGETIYNDSVSSNSNSKEIPVQQLNESYMYNVTIAAGNSAGKGPTNTYPVQIKVPGPVKDLTAEMSYSNATLRWSKPSFNPDDVTHYKVKHANLKSDACTTEFEESDLVNAATDMTETNMIVLQNLSSNTCYIFAVIAYSLSGAGLAMIVTNMTLHKPITYLPQATTPVVTQLTTLVTAQISATSILPTTPTIVENTDGSSNILVLAAGAGGGGLVVVIVIVVLVCIVVSVSSRRSKKKSPTQDETEMFSYNQPNEYDYIIMSKPEPVVLQDVNTMEEEATIDMEPDMLELATTPVYAAIDDDQPLGKEGLKEDTMEARQEYEEQDGEERIVAIEGQDEERIVEQDPEVRIVEQDPKERIVEQDPEERIVEQDPEERIVEQDPEERIVVNEEQNEEEMTVVNEQQEERSEVIVEQEEEKIEMVVGLENEEEERIEEERTVQEERIGVNERQVERNEVIAEQENEEEERIYANQEIFENQEIFVNQEQENVEEVEERDEAKRKEEENELQDGKEAEEEDEEQECEQYESNIYEEMDGEEEIEFDPKIPVTHPMPLVELSWHVYNGHLNSNAIFSEQYKRIYTGADKTCAISAKWKEFNRFKNVAPYDDNLVTLSPIENCSAIPRGFINASIIDGYYFEKKYIAAQGPLKKTLADFWWLVWQERPLCIIMVTNLLEGGKKKCEQYWPSSLLEQESYGPFTVTLLDEQVLPDLITRKLHVWITELPHSGINITQYHFTSWPDHGVPEYGIPLLKLHKKATAGWRRGGPPILVHCSAGVGRTGTFITIDLAMEQAENEGMVDIAGIVNRLREQRMKMVQTEAQYLFIHDVLLEALVCGHTEISSSCLVEEIEMLQQMNSETDKTGFCTQFDLLNEVSWVATEDMFTTALSNPDKNRSSQHIPLDRWRVYLQSEYPGYINASYVKGYCNKRAFIIAQSPMENTVRDFWKMVMEYKVPAVVMLCDLIENDQETCYKYWPESEVSKYGEFFVEEKSQVEEEWFVKREMQVTKEGSLEEWEMTHFHVKNWSSEKKLDIPFRVVELIEDVQRVQRKIGKGPVVVHCSDTVGRSGIYCAVSNALEQCKAEGVVDVFQTVKAIRMQKQEAVSTVEQYETVFDVVKAYVTMNDTYSNFQ